MKLKDALSLLSQGKKVSIIDENYYFFYGSETKDKQYVIFRFKDDNYFKYAKNYVWDVTLPDDGYYEYSL